MRDGKRKAQMKGAVVGKATDEKLARNEEKLAKTECAIRQMFMP